MDSLPKDRSDLSIDDMVIPKMQEIEREEENFEDEEMNDTIRQYELQKAIEENPALAAQLGRREPPTTFDDLPKNTSPMVEPPTEEELREARIQRLIDAAIIPAVVSDNMEQIVGPGREQGFDDPRGIGATPAGSGIPLRTDGPRVPQNNGGYTPFLRSMRDRIRRRFR